MDKKFALYDEVLDMELFTSKNKQEVLDTMESYLNTGYEGGLRVIEVESDE